MENGKHNESQRERERERERETEIERERERETASQGNREWNGMGRVAWNNREGKVGKRTRHKKINLE